MNGRKRDFIRVGLALVVVSALAPAVTGAEVRPRVQPNGLLLETDEANGRRLLTVSGPGGFYQRRTVGEETTRMEATPGDGVMLADGFYVWELRRMGADRGRPGDVQAGHFWVRSGTVSLADESAVERPGAGAPSPPSSVGLPDPDPLAPDVAGDFYIDGRLAIGTSIDGTESFGFATLLMEEDNLAIDFDDTSSIPGFANTDWRIRINDSSSGGAAYFRIEEEPAATQPFRIDAGALTDSIRIDQNGRVGIGTATPGTLLHVAGEVTIDGNLSVLSSRDAKRGFDDVDAAAVLARLSDLPVVEWSYLGSDARHLGPLAEDFHAAFGLGRDAHAIHPMDLAGVALAAIQGLEERVAGLVEENAAIREISSRREREIERLEVDRQALAKRLAALEEQVSGLARSSAAPPG